MYRSYNPLFVSGSRITRFHATRNFPGTYPEPIYLLLGFRYSNRTTKLRYQRGQYSSKLELVGDIHVSLNIPKFCQKVLFSIHRNLIATSTRRLFRSIAPAIFPRILDESRVTRG